MYISPVNSKVSFNSVYKVPYTEEGFRNLNSVLCENYRQAFDEMQHRADNKTWVTLFNKRLWEEPAPIPIGTDLLAIATVPLRIVNGGNPNNPILILNELKPCNGRIVSDIEFALRSINDGKSITNITKSEANILGIKYYKDYSLYKHSDKLLSNRVEVLKNKGINLPELPYQKVQKSKNPQEYFYVLSQNDCLDYCKYTHQDRLNYSIDEVRQEKPTKTAHVKLRNLMDRLGILASFEKDSSTPQWETTVYKLIKLYTRKTENYNKFLSKREIKEVPTVKKLIELLQKE